MMLPWKSKKACIVKSLGLKSVKCITFLCVDTHMDFLPSCSFQTKLGLEPKSSPSRLFWHFAFPKKLLQLDSWVALFLQFVCIGIENYVTKRRVWKTQDTMAYLLYKISCFKIRNNLFFVSRMHVTASRPRECWRTPGWTVPPPRLSSPPRLSCAQTTTSNSSAGSQILLHR